MSPRWSRSSCSSLVLAAALCLGAAPPAKPKAATAAAKPAAKWVPQLLREVEARYSKAATMRAQFDQSVYNSALDQTKKSTGVVMVKRPGKFRWQVDGPEPSLSVTDGKRFWHYTPPFDASEPGQVMEGKATDVRTRLLDVLLSGSFSLAQDASFKQESALVFTLTPKAGTAGTVEKARLEIEPVGKLIRRITLTQKGGNRTELELKDVKLGEDLGDEPFRFQAPKGTDRVGS